MQLERAVYFSDEQQQRYNAVAALVQLFELSQMVYVQSIQQLGVLEVDAQRQLERIDVPCRKMMLKHVEAVMALDKDFEAEVMHDVVQIKRVLGMQ